MHQPDYQEISRKFRQRQDWSDDVPLNFPSEGVGIYYRSFQSRRAGFLTGQDSYECMEHHLTFPAEPTRHSPSDQLIEENLRFRYPLTREMVTAGPPSRHTRGVIILHGLNERSFTKYIPWAFQLWRRLRAPVVLFPLPFHINRVNPTWLHMQARNLEERRALPGNQNVHRFNAVMSDRLGTHPERFFWGALQGYWDLVDFVTNVRSDADPHFTPDAVFDLLGFSAGGYVSLALLLENHRDYFGASRGVLFSTCCAMRDASFCSHLIVDQIAEIELMNLYVKHQEKLSGPRFHHWLNDHREGTWIRCFCGLKPARSDLDPGLKKLAPRLLGIANANDQVIPAGAMMNALQGIHRTTGVRVVELELGIHENPFVSDHYDPSDRSILLRSLNENQFGRRFDEFIDLIVDHFGRP